jgi:eukaryotic-like serine/threonine-protein kinase
VEVEAREKGKAVTSPRDAPGSSNTGASSPVDVAERAGAQIGRYKLLEQIGEGGMGTIWMAEQREPVKRRVALKIIKLGMDTKQVIARFEAERQALAMMDHPHIAKVLDAGATDTGRPYFVMEYIKGIPILEYCDKEKLDTGARLQLFTSVCNAIQHAHTKGIIHRDIKPSNVLVTLHDGVPVTKVIDFGIAKATNSELTTRTLFTEHRQMIGTPAYMSPEQAEMSGLDIDTRSDVYSLGVLLYELLTGTTPFTTRDLLAQGFAEMMRTIREVEPHKPSTRISTLGDTGARTAELRRAEQKKLSLLLRGDIDWIVMKCLEKDRARRYETANGLAADIQRHLEGDAVLAAPPSASYQARKFVRRHRAQVAAAALVVTALVLGLVGTLWQANIASARAAVATRAEAEAKTARDDEKSRADELEKVGHFQEKMLAQVDPTTAGVRLSEDVNRRFAAALDKDGLQAAERAARIEGFHQSWVKLNATDVAATVIDEVILQNAAKGIDERFADQPLVAARLQQTLADRYRDLGRYDAADPLQKSALETRRRVLGEGDSSTLASMNSMGELLLAEGKLTEAETIIRETLEKRRRVLGEEHRDTLASINDVGRVLEAQHRRAEAEPYYREALEKRRRVLGEDDPDTLASTSNLGNLLELLGYSDDKGQIRAEGERYLREAMERRERVLGADHPDTLASIGRIGDVFRAQAERNTDERDQVDPKLVEAERYYREALEKSRRVLGEDHPRTFEFLSKLGNVLVDMNKPTEAEACFREAMERSRRVLGEDHPDTIDRIFRLGAMLTGTPEGLRYWREALEKRRRVRGETHPDTLSAALNLAQVLRDVYKQPAEGEALIAEEVAAYQRAYPAPHPATAFLLRRQAETLGRLGRIDDAEAEARRSVAMYLEHPGVDSQARDLESWSLYESSAAAYALASILMDRGRVDEALAVRREMLSAQRRGAPAGSADFGDVILGCAEQMMQIRTLVAVREAEPLLRECLPIWVEHRPDEWILPHTRSLLGEAIVLGAELDTLLTPESRAARLRAAEPPIVESYAILEKMAPPSAQSGPRAANLDFFRRAAIARAVHLYEVWNRTEPGLGYDAKAAEWKAKLPAKAEKR